MVMFNVTIILLNKMCLKKKKKNALMKLVSYLLLNYVKFSPLYNQNTTFVS